MFLMRKLGTIIDSLKEGKETPTRHHNPYLKQALSLADYLYTEQDLKKHNPLLFSVPTQDLIIEVGCYMGKNVIELAQNNPDKNILGLDITYKRVVKSAQKLKNRNLVNGKIVICDGSSFLSEYIPDKSVSVICVFFPDPWPKDRHEKNRLLKRDFVQLMMRKLKPQGRFWFKTDSLPYFENTQRLLFEAGFREDGVKQPASIGGGPYETAFQRIFTQKNIPFYENVYISG
jgi:tRNA (guanine-N7-)-methyltransferase